MVADLAVALVAIGVRTLVAETVRGAPMNRDSWATVAADVVDALVKAPIRPTTDPVHVGERLGQQIAQLSDKIDAVPVREFEQRMAAGRRFLRDLPRDWRTDQERRELIRDARGEFVRAAAGAELMNDPRRRALAEVAIAGCWLWVPSIPDVKNTVGEARRILEQEILFGATLPTSEYADVSSCAGPTASGRPRTPRRSCRGRRPWHRRPGPASRWRRCPARGSSARASS